MQQEATGPIRLRGREGGTAVGLGSSGHKERSMWKGKKKKKKKKISTNYRNYVQHGFQTHTHPDRLIDEPNESPQIKGGK